MPWAICKQRATTCHNVPQRALPTALPHHHITAGQNMDGNHQKTTWTDGKTVFFCCFLWVFHAIFRPSAIIQPQPSRLQVAARGSIPPWRYRWVHLQLSSTNTPRIHHTSTPGRRAPSGNCQISPELPGLVNIQKTMERSTIFNG